MDTVILVSRQLLLFAHLVAFALAFATILREDLALMRSWRIDVAQLERTGRIVVLLLAALWLTGGGLILLDVGTDLSAFLNRPKLMTKVGVVALLTINGLLLHTVAFPMLTRPQSHPGRAAAICAVLGAVSSVSWGYAAFVGTARIISPMMTLESFLSLYVIALAVGLGVALVVVRPMVRHLIQSAGRPALG
ncbi:hypothetical protein [Mitsuaria sp. GD03876]|uniref:hypothetical protein n=1 Tax=Mitsuaria sp. GD03876 TaxID=2975399 RepID=UPI00244707B7|nr:hypothetical protein [Mitsuaria sp. GD03876]MDH0863398.1 hypothetical protein [Mitsuaria sp. GD03876]